MEKKLRIGIVGLGNSGLDALFRRGLIRYCRPDKPWHLIDALHDRSLFERLQVGQIDGVIANVTERSCAMDLKALNCPVVNLSSVCNEPEFAQVVCDDEKIGTFAAQYFIDRGFRSGAYFGERFEFPYDRERKRGFASRFTEQGLAAYIYQRPTFPADMIARERWWRLSEHMKDWLQSLPKPIGIFTPTDRVGNTLSSICRGVGLEVPDELSILGAGDDALICEMQYPPLSSVRMPGEEVGELAAEILEKAIGGNAACPGVIKLPVTSITTRLSSDVFAVDDRLVHQALRFIQNHYVERINVADIVKALNVDRRDMERRFQKYMGRSPHQQIQRVRIERAKQLLANPMLSMAVVSEMSGLRDSGHMAHVFSKEVGVSPSKYRKELSQKK